MTIKQENKYLAPIKMAALILPLDIQFFNGDLEGKIMHALNELKEADKRRDDEVKSYGEATQETKTKIEGINDAIDAMQKQLQEVAAKSARIVEPEVKDGQTPEQLERKSAFIKYLKEGKNGLTPEERTALNTIGTEVKALVEDSQGEIIVPEDLDGVIYKNKMEDVVLRSLAFVRPTTSNRVRRIGMNDVTGGWGKLETSTTKTLADFESTLTPNEAYLYVENLLGLTKLGEDELMDSAINLEQYLAQSFRDVFKHLESVGFLRGRGHSFEEPEGILLDANVSTYTTKAAGTLTADDMINLMYGVKNASYRKNGVYLVNTEIERQMRLFKDGNGQYLFSPSLQAGVPSVFNGRPVHVEDSFEAFASGTKQAVFGDIKQGYQIVDRKGLAIIRLNEKYIENDLIGFRAKQRVGGGVVRPAALTTLTIQ